MHIDLYCSYGAYRPMDGPGGRVGRSGGPGSEAPRNSGEFLGDQGPLTNLPPYHLPPYPDLQILVLANICLIHSLLHLVVVNFIVVVLVLVELDECLDALTTSGAVTITVAFMWKIIEPDSTAPAASIASK